MMLEVEWAGQVDYMTAWEMQKDLVAERKGASLPDRLLLLEHPPTYTLGRSGRLENMLLDEDALAAEGFSLHRVDRGGDITYHGPGQLVGYPIINLKRLQQRDGRSRPDLHLYLRQIEEVIIQALAGLGVAGWRYDGYTGVWVTCPDGPRKIAAIGIKVSARGISSHGFALNVNPNMAHFAGIVPCGIVEHGVTSLAALVERPLTVIDLLKPIVAAVANVFNMETVFVGETV